MRAKSTATKRCTACKQFQAAECFHKNRSKPDGLATECKPCAIAKAKLRFAADPEAHRERMRADYQKKSEVYKARARQWEADNRQHKNTLNKAWRERNPEKARDISRNDWQIHNAKRLARKKLYRQETPEKQAAMCRRYQARKLKAMPPWADKEKIEAVYAEARRLTLATGIPHHVDHIYPLRGKNVSGLHIHTNLQVLTAFDNQSKGNKIAA